MNVEVIDGMRFCSAVGMRAQSLLLGWMLFMAASSLTAEERFPTLQIGSQTYSNVTVTSKTPQYVVIMHSQGLTSLKLKELPQETLEQLGYDVGPPPPPPTRSPITALLPQNLELDPKIKEMETKTIEEAKERLRKIDPKILLGIVAALFLIYLFACYCLMLICKKTGNEPGLLVWLPILQRIPLLKAAGMPVWWFVLWLLPFTNLLAIVVWCFKICQARGKSAWLGFLLLLPLTNIMTFLYLAFADRPEKEVVAEKITFA